MRILNLGKHSFIGYGYARAEHPEPSKFERHCHEYCELLYVVEGEGKYVVEGAEYPLKPHTLLLIRPYEFHSVSPSSDHVYSRYVIQFDRAMPVDAAATLSILQSESNRGCGVYFSAEHLSENIPTLFEEIMRLPTILEGVARRQEKEETMLRAYLTQILIYLSLEEHEKVGTQENNIIARLIEYVNRNLTDDISLDRLAQSFFVSKYYLCHAFREHTGVSVFTYINTKRILMAQRLIANGVPATSAAYQVGFRNYSSFYRAYCKQMGEPPVHRRSETCLKKEE